MAAPKQRLTRSRMTQRYSLIGGLLTLLFGLVIYGSDVRGYAWDFHQFYAIGSLEASQTYDVNAQMEMEERLWRENRPWVPEFNYSPYLKPAYYRLVWVPLARLPFWTAFIVWVAIQTIAFAAALVLLGRRYKLDSALFVLLPMCPYLMLTLFWGQDTCLLFFLIVLSLELGLRKREGWAGAVLALGLFKWNTILMIPAAMLFQKRWKTTAAFSAVALVEVATSVWITGIDGTRDYLALARHPASQFWSANMPSLRGILLTLGASHVVTIALMLAVVAAFLWKCRTLDLETTYAAGASIGVFLAFHTMRYDLLLSLITIVILYRPMTKGWKAAVTVLFLSPAPYFAYKAFDVLSVRAAFVALLVVVVLTVREKALAARQPASIGLVRTA